MGNGISPVVETSTPYLRPLRRRVLRTWVRHLGWVDFFLRKGLVVGVAGDTGVVANAR